MLKLLNNFNRPIHLRLPGALQDANVRKCKCVEEGLSCGASSNSDGSFREQATAVLNKGRVLPRAVSIQRLKSPIAKRKRLAGSGMGVTLTVTFSRMGGLVFENSMYL